MNMTKNRFFWVAALVSLVLDQLTKRWVVQNFDLNETWPLWKGVFHFTYVRNPGAAFSLFSQDGSWLRWLSLGVSIVLIALALFGPKLPAWDQLGYGFILGGALGNGIDRFLLNYVVDFVDFRLIRFPVFNVADTFINIGIACLFIAAFRKHEPPKNRP
ncbi:signal peptidase II [Aerosakkonema sp. BLCC-F183]|uniref:signal peptidase II n=1 Tax=Aerosakkonema sp. BLCC-F183 TaxID=3342834 RepID=UPI0035BA3C47